MMSQGQEQFTAEKQGILTRLQLRVDREYMIQMAENFLVRCLKPTTDLETLL